MSRSSVSLSAVFLLPLLQAAAQNVSPSAAPFTLRASTNLVVVDVVVYGADGRAVHGLTQADFSLREDGKPQTLRSFREYTSHPAEPRTGALSAPPKLAPGLFTNYVPGRLRWAGQHPACG